MPFFYFRVQLGFNLHQHHILLSHPPPPENRGTCDSLPRLAIGPAPSHGGRESLAMCKNRQADLALSSAPNKTVEEHGKRECTLLAGRNLKRIFTHIYIFY